MIRIENRKMKTKKYKHHNKMETLIAKLDDGCYPMVKNSKSLSKALRNLDRMVGLKEPKDEVLKMTKSAIIDSLEPNSGAVYHTVLAGPPGVGKTHFAKMIGRILISLNMVKKREDKDTPSSKQVSEKGGCCGTPKSNGPSGKEIQWAIEKGILEGKIAAIEEKNKVDNGVFTNILGEINNHMYHLNNNFQMLNGKSMQNQILPHDTPDIRANKHILAAEISYHMVSLNACIQFCTHLQDMIRQRTQNPVGPDKMIGGLTIILGKPPSPPSVQKASARSAPPGFPVPSQSNGGKNDLKRVNVDDDDDDDELDKYFMEACIDDMVASYVGQTAPKMKAFLESCRGKVVFIDEAYKLYDGRTGSGDFLGLALTMIVEWMDKHRDETIFIFAGYTKELRDTIFRIQPGLERRCQWVFNFKSYTAEELFKIFEMKRQSTNLTWAENVKDEDVIQHIKENMELFPCSGGDMERLILRLP